MEPCEARTAPNRFTEAVDSLKNCCSVCIIVHLSCFTWKLPWSQAFGNFLSILVATRQRPVTIVVPDTNHRCHCRYCRHKSRVYWWPTAAADPIGSLTSYKKHLSTVNVSAKKCLQLSTDVMQQHDNKNGKLNFQISHWFGHILNRSSAQRLGRRNVLPVAPTDHRLGTTRHNIYQVAKCEAGGDLVDTAGIPEMSCLMGLMICNI